MGRDGERMQSGHADSVSQTKPDQIKVQAAEWFERINLGALDEAETQAFRDWLHGSPAHARAYQRLEQTWLDLPFVEDAQARAEHRPTAQTGRVLAFRRRVKGPAMWAGVAATLLIAAFLVVAPLRNVAPELASEAALYATSTGERRTVVLADGSTVRLSAETRLETVFDEDRRTVVLTEGAAYFDVMRDEHRPFIVVADAARVTVLGTEFEVWRGADEEVRVSVREGRVETSALASRGGAISASRTLVRGQRVFVSPTGRMGDVAAFNPDDVLALSEGRFIYDDARLSTVISDINRYRSSKVRLSPEALSDQRVTAAFQVEGIDGFLQTLASVEGYVLEERADETLIVSPE